MPAIELNKQINKQKKEQNKQQSADSLELTEGQYSHGVPQPLPLEQQQDALETPMPISLEQTKFSDASPRGRASR